MEGEGREEYADGRDEELEFGVRVGAGLLVGDYVGLGVICKGEDELGGWQLTVIIDELLNVSHDLCVAAMGARGHLIHRLSPWLEDGSGLRVQHEWYG